jgi:hypothetical protein
MVRKGEDVASSYLKFDWGPTNVVAGAYFWKKRMKKAIKARKAINSQGYIELKIEELSENFDQYCYDLDEFMYKATGRTDLSLLKDTLKNYAKPVKHYESAGLTQKLVTYVVNNVNRELGYSNYEKVDRNLILDVLVGVFLLVDYPLILFNKIKRSI